MEWIKALGKDLNIYQIDRTSAPKVSSLEYISQPQARNMHADTDYLYPLAEGLEKCYNSFGEKSLWWGGGGSQVGMIMCI